MPVHDMSSNLPETFMLESILAKERSVPPGSTPSQTKYGQSKMTGQRQLGKLTLSLQATRQSSSLGFPYLAALHLGAPSQ